MINLEWENTNAVTYDAREVVLENRTRIVILLQERKEIQQADNRIWSELLLMVLVFCEPECFSTRKQWKQRI